MDENGSEMPGFDYIIPISSIVTMSESVQSILTVGNVILLIFAICGNLVAIFIILRSRLSRKTTRCLLLTLSISDIILSISSIPVDLGYITSKYHTWVLGSFICENVSFFQMGAIIMNAFALFAIALERYLSVTRSLEKPRNRSSCKYIPYFRLLCVWTLPIVAAIPQFWSYKIFSFKTYNDALNVSESGFELSNETYYVCYQRDASSSSVLYNAIFYCTVACVFTSLLVGFLFCYLSIIHFIKAHGYKFDRTKSGLEISTATTSETTLSSTTALKPSKSPRNRHRKTIRLIMTLILIFCVCRIPVWIFLVYTNITQPEYNKTMLTMMKFLHLLSNLSAALSPLFYAVWNDSLKMNKRVKRGRISRRATFFSRWACSSKNGNAKSNPLAVFVISKIKQDRYDFVSQANSHKDLIEENNTCIVWNQRSSAHY